MHSFCLVSSVFLARAFPFPERNRISLAKHPRNVVWRLTFLIAAMENKTGRWKQDLAHLKLALFNTLPHIYTYVCCIYKKAQSVWTVHIVDSLKRWRKENSDKNVAAKKEKRHSLVEKTFSRRYCSDKIYIEMGW